MADGEDFQDDPGVGVARAEEEGRQRLGQRQGQGERGKVAIPIQADVRQ